jgi:molecular chaperone GrpE
MAGEGEANQENKEGKEPEEAKQQPQQDSAKEIAEVKDRLLRLAAEFDNYKKKVAKDIDNAKDLGKADLIRSLLPALDEFELALYSLNNSVKDDCNAKGIELVFSNFLGALKSAGLREIESKGRYDPYKHEIMMTKDSKEPEGTIIEVVRKGYSFRDMMLRPSAVIVSKGEDSLNEKENENKK